MREIPFGLPASSESKFSCLVIGGDSSLNCVSDDVFLSKFFLARTRGH
jgi:hypothetical protein